MFRLVTRHVHQERLLSALSYCVTVTFSRRLRVCRTVTTVYYDLLLLYGHEITIPRHQSFSFAPHFHFPSLIYLWALTVMFCLRSLFKNLMT